ncbi:hypothetical protein [Pedobacter sp.]|uniref:hypothetical protein n=1 Tax=Pedobacter sp. TaxID=1411316 RepID=UPI0031E1156A
MATTEKSPLSTRLPQEYLDTLKESLPTDWAEKVREKTGFSLGKIRGVIKGTGKYDEVVIDAFIEYADEYKAEAISKVQSQIKKINSLIL